MSIKEGELIKLAVDYFTGVISAGELRESALSRGVDQDSFDAWYHRWWPNEETMFLGFLRMTDEEGL